jgi:hypothetical protein
MPNPILILNQPYVNVGLDTVTYTAPSAGLYNVTFSATVPQALATGSGSGSGQGLGAGKGGGTLGGFALGGGGLGDGAVGQAFGADLSGYQQPPAAGSNQVSGAAVSSALSVLVKVNGATVYTMASLSPTQSASQFKYGMSLNAADVVTVVLSSANASDSSLNGLISQIAVNQGL